MEGRMTAGQAAEHQWGSMPAEPQKFDAGALFVLKSKGPRWGRYYVGPIQFSVCYGTVVATTLLGGQTLKAIYVIILSGAGKEPTMKLYEFVAFFGVLILLLAQIPSFHSLRHINLVSAFLCLSYSICATAASIYIGSSPRSPAKDYSLAGSGPDRIFGALNAFGIIATTFGNGIIPEIQATAAPPVAGKMFKGLCLCYAVVSVTFFSVAISGYWAFGNSSEGSVLVNLLGGETSPLVPRWFLLMTNAFALLQISAVTVVTTNTNKRLHQNLFKVFNGKASERGAGLALQEYLQPTNDV